MDATITFFKDLIRKGYLSPVQNTQYAEYDSGEMMKLILSAGKAGDSDSLREECEEQIKQMTGRYFALSTLNCAVAMKMALHLVDVEKGDEVLTQSLAGLKGAKAIKSLEAEPVFLDVDQETLGLSPDAINEFLEEYGELREDGCYNKATQRRISACMPVYTGGYPLRIEEIVTVCGEWGIPVVEDATEALGTRVNGKTAGSFGEVGVLSFSQVKTCKGRGGGAIVTDDKGYYEYARYCFTSLNDTEVNRTENTTALLDIKNGTALLPTMQCALINYQLGKVQDLITRRHELAKRYDDFFSTTNYRLILSRESDYSRYSTILLEVEDREQRNSLIRETVTKGISTMPLETYQEVHSEFDHCYRDEHVHTQTAKDQVVCLPSAVRLFK